MNEAAEITVVVLSAKGLKSKRQGKCKFSVIFGVGSKKYRTTVVKDPDGNPEWNEESTIQVGNSLDQVFFIVTEKDDVLGQVNVPITNLSGPPGHTTIETLQPHKKCPNPKGELVYRCHVSQYRQAQIPIIKSGSPNNFESKSSSLNFKKRFSIASITNSPIINLKNRRDGKQGGGSGSKLSTLNKKFSRSIQDIFSFGKSHQDEENHNQRKPSGHNYMSIGTGLDSAGRCPMITSVTPSCGLIEGGTKVTIEGKYLGLSKADIMELTICECDCVESVIWESSNRIHCTTKPSLPGIGDVVIETESGGIGCLRNIYSYVEDLPQEEEVFTDEESDQVDGRRSASFTVGDGSVSSSPLTPKKTVQVILPRAESSENVPGEGVPPKNSFMKHKRRASEGFILAPSSRNRLGSSSPEPVPSVDSLLMQIEKLRLENIALKQENKDMKSYIDRLLPKVIMNCPEALEAERYLNKTG
ncbi:uncharacterized protein LOC111128182 isoform X2 [Crassostrea virginica]